MFRPKKSAIYLGDNGRALCGEHLGASTRMTGFDLSGQAIYEVTPEDVAYLTANGDPVATCERPGCGKTPPRLHLPELLGRPLPAEPDHPILAALKAAGESLADAEEDRS